MTHTTDTRGEGWEFLYLRCPLCGRPIGKHIVPDDGFLESPSGFLCPTDARLKRNAGEPKP